MPGFDACFKAPKERQFALDTPGVAGAGAVSGVAARDLWDGFDADKATLLQHYFDSRGVARVYEMTFAEGPDAWERFAPAPDYSQRFTGTFGEDDNTIVGRWEISSDGSNGNPDFDLTYTRMR